jgi:hypothetical protein
LLVILAGTSLTGNIMSCIFAFIILLLQGVGLF